MRQLAVLRGPHDQADRRRPPREARVDVAFAVGHDHHRSRLGQMRPGLRRAVQPAHGFLVLQRACPRRHGGERVRAGPESGVQQAQHSLRLAVDGDHRVDEKASRHAVARRSQATATLRAAGEVDLRRVLAAMIRRPVHAAAVRVASVAAISPHVAEAADRNRWIAISPARSQPSLRITSDPVSITRCISRVPTAARRISPKPPSAPSRLPTKAPPEPTPTSADQSQVTAASRLCECRSPVEIEEESGCSCRLSPRRPAIAM